MSTQTKRILKVGSRESKLALIQSNYLISLLKEKNPDLEFESVSMTTPGDRDLSQSIVKIGNSALWSMELESALKEGRVDMIVHSLKDVAVTLPEDLVLGCILKRANPHDAIVMNPRNQDKTLATLPKGSVVGTSSLRRAAQIKRNYPHLQIFDIRGNIDGRIKKLDESGQYDALCLAAAALERMGPDYEKRTSQILSAGDCLYAVSQAALAVECRADDQQVLDILEPFHDSNTVIRVVAERAYLRRLMGGCSEPIGTESILENNTLTLKGGVFSAEGDEAVLDEETRELPGNMKDICQDMNGPMKSYSSIVTGRRIRPETLRAAETLGLDLAERMAKNGAEAMLDVVRKEIASFTDLGVNNSNSKQSNGHI